MTIRKTISAFRFQSLGHGILLGCPSAAIQYSLSQRHRSHLLNFQFASGNLGLLQHEPESHVTGNAPQSFPQAASMTTSRDFGQATIRAHVDTHKTVEQCVPSIPKNKWMRGGHEYSDHADSRYAECVQLTLRNANGEKKWYSVMVSMILAIRGQGNHRWPDLKGIWTMSHARRARSPSSGISWMGRATIKPPLWSISRLIASSLLLIPSITQPLNLTRHLRSHSLANVQVFVVSVDI